MKVHTHCHMCIAQVLETLVKIRRQDPSIYNTETKFFGSDEEEEEGEDDDADERPRKKAKPLYLRDAIAKQASGVHDTACCAGVH